MRIDTRRQCFDTYSIPNRRFMYNPQTGTLLLGKCNYGGARLKSSHAEEHGRIIGSKEPFDDFIRGWIGTNKDYPYAVIHFAPPIAKENLALYEKGFSTLEMFVKNRELFDKNCKIFSQNRDKQGILIRGFPGKWEQPLSDIIAIVEKPTLMKRLEQNKRHNRQQSKQQAETRTLPVKMRKSNTERG